MKILVMVFHGVQWQFEYVSLTNIPALLDSREVIYNNGDAQIWAPR